MLKKARLLTRPTLADTSPTCPESAKTASSPKDAPCPMQGRSSAADPRFTFHASRFTALGSAARTPLADFFSILLDLGLMLEAIPQAKEQRASLFHFFGAQGPFKKWTEKGEVGRKGLSKERIAFLG